MQARYTRPGGGTPVTAAFADAIAARAPGHQRQFLPLCRPLGACSGSKPARADAAAGQLVHAPAESGELAAWLNHAAVASPDGSTGRAPAAAAQPRAAAVHGAPGAEDSPRTHLAALPCDTEAGGQVLAHGPLPGSVAGQPGGGGDPDDVPAAQAGRPGWSAVDRPRPLEEEAHACGAPAGALVCSMAGGLPLPGGRNAGAAQDGLGDCSPTGQRPHAAEDAAAGAAAGEGLGGLLAYLDSLEAPHACPAVMVRGPATAL